MTVIALIPVTIVYFKRPPVLYQIQSKSYLICIWLYLMMALLVRTTFYIEADLLQYWNRISAANGDDATLIAIQQRPLSRLYVADPLILGIMMAVQILFSGPLPWRTILCWTLPITYTILQLCILPPPIYITSGLLSSLQLYVTALASAVFMGRNYERFMRLNFYIAYRRLKSKINVNVIETVQRPVAMRSVAQNRLKTWVKPSVDKEKTLAFGSPVQDRERTLAKLQNIYSTVNASEKMLLAENRLRIVESHGETVFPITKEQNLIEPVVNDVKNQARTSAATESLMNDDDLIKEIVQTLELNIALALDSKEKESSTKSKKSSCSCLTLKSLFYRYIWLSHPDPVFEERVREHLAIRPYNTGFTSFLILTLSVTISILSAHYQDLYSSYRIETEYRQLIRLFPLTLGLLFCSLGRPRLPKHIVRHCELFCFVLYFIAGAGAFSVYALTLTTQNRKDFDYFGFEVAVEYIVILTAVTNQVSVRYGALFSALIIMVLAGLRFVAPIANFVLFVPFVATPFAVGFCSLMERQYRLHFQT